MKLAKLTIQYPNELSRATLLIRTFFAFFYVMIPHGIILGLRGIAVLVIQFLAFWIVLFTGKYPEGMFNFVVETYRWINNVIAYMYFFTDKYPPFSGSQEGNADSPVKTEIAYPENISRGLLLIRIFFGYFYVMIPHGVMLFFRGIGTAVLSFVAWWIVLFTGKYPEGMFQFNVGTIRWYLRLNTYMSFMTDVYPPFTGEDKD